MKDTKVERSKRQVQQLKQQFLQGNSGVFDSILNEQGTANTVNEWVKPYRERLYPPLETLRLFVGQVL